ncbi:MAG: SAM-dependent methyltransferase [Butyrivibrio sp.]|nr:SAM-dependent methyltransferase [Muribaculum sp.]MCM1553461.1 SAM-dependent methyltransferase [Butyrivibrio sp.]
MRYISAGTGADEEEYLDELNGLLEEILNIDLQQIVLSNTRDEAQGTKVKVRPVLLKGELVFQETMYRGTQVFHENCDRDTIKKRITDYLNRLFKQGEFAGDKLRATVLVSKKGKLSVKTRRSTERNTAAREKASVLSHDRAKQYILMDGTPVDFLVGLGVQTPDGRVVKAKYDKFRQINRYLEFIEDVLDELPADRTIRIIDFGCGKSYLTFAMYYYLHELQGRDIMVTGLDLKQEVIEHCNRLAQSLDYRGLSFERGDISTYDGAEQADMVVSLHACDKATDYALEKAVRWGARVIMAVPCCQHELNGQMRCETLQPILKYGLIKERMAALVTDALRANLLEQQGYDTQILEFIDMEHTPKNLMIRAVKKNETGMKRRAERSDIQEVTDLLNVSPTLEQLLK